MPVQIDFEATTLNADGTGGFLRLTNPERDEDYASWPFHVRPDDHPLAGETNVWEWDNPDDPLDSISLSPSLKLTWDEPNTFHVFVDAGEIEHCGDCQCGCQP